ncbi:MAG: hypothetical protein U0S48_13560 [Solirubrobacteraceae bacterium]
MAALAFTILVRLPDGYAPGSGWDNWRAACIRAGGLGSEIADKRYPGGRDYFAPQVERVLFPGGPTRGDAERWVQQPLALDIELANALTTYVLAVDLLEIVRTALAPGVTFGLAHLSANGVEGRDAMVDCAQAIAKRWRWDDADPPKIALRRDSEVTPLLGHEPLRLIADRLFGAAHPHTMHRAHVFVLARVPSEVSLAEESIWRRAVGRGQSETRAEQALRADQGREHARTEAIGGARASFYELSSLVSYREDSSPGWMYTARSYWCECVLYGLLQQSFLETLAADLAQLGRRPMHDRAIDVLFERWVAFLNVLWWRELSYTGDVPGRILRHVHREMSTDSLFDDLRLAFSTYVDARRHRTSDAAQAALRGLQVYGAAFAVIGTAATVAQVWGERYLATNLGRLVMVVGLLALGIAAAVVISAMLDRRERRVDQ